MTKIKHGCSGTKLYHVWGSINTRCYNKHNKDYKNYGARGVKVCDEWRKDFNKFKEWSLLNGYKDGLTIDRKDVNGNYEPDNCRWTTYFEQMNNTRRNHYITYNGQTKTLAQWSAALGINNKTLHSRINNYNWNIEKAFTTPVKNKIKIT